VTTHVLVVDDEALLRRSLAFNLEQAGYRTSSAANAEDALALARRDPPDLVLLDIGLPGMDGLEALRLFRADVSAPVILVTARRRELDQVVGLELGADDYITKPFDSSVLLARMKAVLRRAARGAAAGGSDTDSSIVTAGDLSIDPNAYVATLRGQALDLSPREFDLLHALTLEAGRVLSVDDLLARVWGAEYVGESQVVYVHIRWLRQKIEEDASKPIRIVTVRGKGYKLLPQMESTST
jgi:DNA-binding response OmpR family regulator